ncbi:hypothetical protein K1719_000581 [Acacia pycnantha]|nr:hypothetical protein K1719_000581 [Acacia pycnantha]
MSLAELMLETGHHDLVQQYFPDAIPSTPPEPYSQSPVPASQPISCIAMLNPYEQDFPPLERKIDSKIDSLTTKTDGLFSQLDQLSEEVKNLYFQYRQQADKLDAELRAFIDRGYMGSQFKQKELELQAIQQDLKKIELDMAKKKSQAIYEPYPSYPSFSTIPAPLFPSSPTSYPETADYSKQFKFNYPLFAQLSPPKLPPQTRPQPRDQFIRPEQRPPWTPFQTYDPGSHSGSKGISINEPIPSTTPTSPSAEKLKQTVSPPNPQPPSYSTVTSVPTTKATTPPNTSSIGILQNSNPFTPLQDLSDSQTESCTPDYSDDSSEAEIADISRIAMVKPGEDEEFDESYVEQPDDHVPRQDNNYKPTSGPWFTFDDLPYEKWRSRLQEFSTWIDLQITAQQIPLRQALQEFVSRFTGTLREWFQNMSPYEKLQAVQVEDAVVLLGAIHKEFIGDFNLIRKREKQEFFEMKYCSLKRSDLQNHYQRMLEKYHMLNGSKYALHLPLLEDPVHERNQRPRSTTREY